jgi:hypothetical protein
MNDVLYTIVIHSIIIPAVTAWTNKIVSLMVTGKYDDEGRVRSDYTPYLGGVG